MTCWSSAGSIIIWLGRTVAYSVFEHLIYGVETTVRGLWRLKRDIDG